MSTSKPMCVHVHTYTAQPSREQQRMTYSSRSSGSGAKCVSTYCAETSARVGGSQRGLLSFSTITSHMPMEVDWDEATFTKPAYFKETTHQHAHLHRSPFLSGKGRGGRCKMGEEGAG